MNRSKNYLTVSELRDVCERLGLPSDGSKQELIERITNFTSIETPIADTNPEHFQPTMDDDFFSRKKLKHGNYFDIRHLNYSNSIEKRMKKNYSSVRKNCSVFVHSQVH